MLNYSQQKLSEGRQTRKHHILQVMGPVASESQGRPGGEPPGSLLPNLPSRATETWFNWFSRFSGVNGACPSGCLEVSVLGLLGPGNRASAPGADPGGGPCWRRCALGPGAAGSRSPLPSAPGWWVNFLFSPQKWRRWQSPSPADSWPLAGWWVALNQWFHFHHQILDKIVFSKFTKLLKLCS